MRKAKNSNISHFPCLNTQRIQCMCIVQNVGFSCFIHWDTKDKKTKNIHLMVALSGSMSKNISSSTSSCMIGLWSAAVRYNFAENRPSWNSPYKRAKAHDLWRRSLVEKLKCYNDFTAYHQLASQQLINFIQHNSRGKVNILGGDSDSHCEKRISYGQVSNSEWLPKQSCLNLQIQNNCERSYRKRNYLLLILLNYCLKAAHTSVYYCNCSLSSIEVFSTSFNAVQPFDD